MALLEVRNVSKNFGGLAAVSEFDLDVEELNEISPRPGTVIGSENFERYAHLFDRDFAKFVEHLQIHGIALIRSVQDDSENSLLARNPKCFHRSGFHSPLHSGSKTRANR